MTKVNNKKALIKSKRTLVIICLIGIIIGIVVVKNPKKKATADSTVSFFDTVNRGPLTIDVTETGTIKAREQEVIKSEIEGRTTILSLVPEATRVKKGDLLVELDATQLKDALVMQQIEVQNAKSSFIGATEDLEVVKSQAESDNEEARLILKFAILDQKKYLDGEYPNQLNEMKKTIELEEKEVERLDEKLKGTRKLEQKKYIANADLKAAEQAHARAKLDLDLAKNNLLLYEDYTHERSLAELESNVKQAEMAVDRVKRKGSADVVQAQAGLTAASLKFDRQEAVLEKMESQIKKATIYAPADGMVVYATSAKGSWRGNDEPLDEGREVHEREELIYLPTADSVKAEIRVHEANMNKVTIGRPVEVEVEALPGKVFMGTVGKIAMLPDAAIAWMNPDLKVYPTEIFIDNESNLLRTGMTCKARIIIADYDNVLYIPVQSVVRIGEQPTVYVKTKEGLVSRAVETGLDNNRMIHIISGLEEGEEVSLTPPFAPGEVQNQRGSRGKKPDVGDEKEDKPASGGQPDGVKTEMGGGTKPASGGSPDMGSRPEGGTRSAGSGRTGGGSRQPGQGRPQSRPQGGGQ